MNTTEIHITNKSRISRTNRLKIYERDGHQCLRCETKKNLTIDHIKPLSKGGTNDLNNLQTLCKSCNLKKGSRIIDYRLVKQEMAVHHTLWSNDRLLHQIDRVDKDLDDLMRYEQFLFSRMNAWKQRLDKVQAKFKNMVIYKEKLLKNKQP